ncbi:hypothetical protein GTY57_32350, partial [Streptomyces sp. SID5475]|nr:hypothetical protein [Streptomyces sp. SID5475]MZE81472.1 hypothetical protein [Streptomyces sp. SID5475]
MTSPHLGRRDAASSGRFQHMNSTMRRVVIGTAAISMALSVAACGEAGS